jgi:phage terminase large subunit GpA-like protein
MLEVADGAQAYLGGLQRGLQPDPDLWIDEWSDQYMRIPRGNGAEYGKYHTDRTPPAREVMRCLSPSHPCRRVVAMVAAQLLKTQVGINFLSASIHQAPGNMLVLMPTLGLARRLSGRIGKTIDEVAPLRERVAAPRSRDSRNTIDTKEFDGGTLYITTAGSAANLAEIPARYVYGDEVDRWEVSVDEEGDPVELAETRTSTFGRNAKIYYTSSPTVEGASRIATLFKEGDQRHFFVPCPHCGEFQTLEWENLWFPADCSTASYVCKHCGAHIEESHKTQMFERGEWRATAVGDGETISFTLSALYSPLGWVPWAALAKQYCKAKEADEKGDPEPMQVFYNTRLARTWDNVKESTKAEDLRARAEDYPLRSVPAAVLVLTASVDTQDNRLELKILGWGEGMERWVLDYQVIHGDPATDGPWNALDEILRTPLRRGNGVDMAIRAVAIDSGGHHTQEVYEFTRRRKYRLVFAVRGASKPGRPIVASQPSKVDISLRGKVEKRGAELWIVGTDTAKDWLHSRWKLADGPGAIHFSQDLPEEFYKQLCSERRLIKYVKGHKRSEWVKAKADRNEALDLSVYNLAAAHRLGLHKWRENDWERERMRLNPPQPDLFITTQPAGPVQPSQPVAPVRPQPAAQRVAQPAPAGGPPAAKKSFVNRLA